MSEIILKVPHYDQIDNDSHLHGPGYRQCNLTSNAMLLDYILKGELTKLSKRNRMREPESYLGFHLHRYGDTTNHNAITRCLDEFFKVGSYWSTTLSPEDVKRSINLGYPVVAGVLYRSSGHIVVIVGYNDRGWFINDPYGSRDSFKDRYLQIGNRSGECDFYANRTLEKIFWEQRKTSNPQTGWGRIVTDIKGKLTGLPKGM